MSRTQARRSGSNVGSQRRFARVPAPSIPRSAFNRSHGYKTTFDAGKLVPIFVDEALPGDTHSMQYAAFARMATALHPIMDNMHMDFFFFAVPYRLLWDNFEKFMGAQDNPNDSTDFLVPQIIAPPAGWQEGDLADYFGIPTGVANIPANALHFRAYNLIFNEWFRSQDLTNSAPVFLDDGPDGTAAYPLQRRTKRHDYFTSCLPWPQKGPAVTLPLGTTAPVNFSLNAAIDVNGPGLPTFNFGGGDIEGLQGDGTTNANWTGLAGNAQAKWENPALHTTLIGYTGATADLANATAATINQIRQSFQVQRMYERDARGGTRYQEINLSHFGTISPDQRLQRPEFLGGGTLPIIINTVPQTFNDEANNQNVADLGAYAVAAGSPRGWTKSFTEHCVLIGLVNVRADINYQQGLNRMWSRQTRFDYYWPSLAFLGEQAVLQKEIYANGTAQDEDVFGYQERYAEYRYKPSVITGAFRSTSPQSLDTWHLGLHFTTPPALDNTFLEDDPPIDRVIAVQDEPQFLFDAHFKYKCIRPMPTYGVPGLIDHF